MVFATRHDLPPASRNFLALQLRWFPKACFAPADLRYGARGFCGRAAHRAACSDRRSRPAPTNIPARIEELRNGDLYAVYYGGEGEYATETGVFGSRLKQGSRKWTTPKRIASDPFRSLGNGVVWQAPDGLVWLFYVVRYGETWSSSRVQAKVSRDNAETWSEAFPLVSEEGMMVCNKPIVLHNGDYLLPLYSRNRRQHRIHRRRQLRAVPPLRRKERRSGNKRAASVRPRATSSRCRLKFAITFSSPTSAAAATSNPRPTAGRSAPNRTTAAGPGAKASIPRFKNPNSAVDFIKLRSGNLLLVFNDSMNERTPLTVALSPDGDQTWPWRRNVAEGPYDYAYPMAVQTRDGKIHLIFTSHERTVVNHAVFDEAWIKQGGPVKSWLPKK